MPNPFKVIRDLARQAVVAGVQDGLREVSPDGEPPADLGQLREASAAALAGPTEEPAAGKARRR